MKGKGEGRTRGGRITREKGVESRETEGRRESRKEE